MSQYDDYMADLAAVIAGHKPAVIIERRKSPQAYSHALTRLNALDIPPRWVDVLLADSSGKVHPAIIAGPNVMPILSLLHKRNQYSRADFQIAMGRLLGYSESDCKDYVKSSLSRTCGCQLCGGPTPESRRDDEARARRLDPVYQ